MSPLYSTTNDQQQQQPVYECPTVGLRSFDDLATQPCTAASDAPTTTTTTADFQFPSWDQLPEDLQNPTSSAEYRHAGISAPSAADTLSMPWDDTMDFAMDMDMDMDLDLDLAVDLNHV